MSEPKKALALEGFTPERRTLFLDNFAKTGNMSESAKVAGVSRVTVYAYIREDKGFRALMNDARLAAADALEAEARRRAVEGWDDPVFFMGNEVGSVRKYSDSLLTLLLKGSKPRRYRERQEVSGDPKRPIKVEAAVQIYIPDNGRGDVKSEEK